MASNLLAVASTLVAMALQPASDVKAVDALTLAVVLC